MQGLSDLAQDIVFHLHDDRLTLRMLALSSRIFTDLAQKSMFEELQVMNDTVAYKYQLRLADFSALFGSTTPPNFLRFVKDLSFTSGTEHFRSSYIIDLLNHIKRNLTGLETVRVFGYDGLYHSWPGREWFSSFINTTKPTTLTFTGMLVPRYILDFDFPSVRVIHFNVCRVRYCKEDTKKGGRKQPFLEAQVILRTGTKWGRVEEVISNAINGETLHMIHSSMDLERLTLRAFINQAAELPNLYMPLGLRSLTLQVPPASVLAIPEFIGYVIQSTPYLERLVMFYGSGWHRIQEWDTIVGDVAQVLILSLFRMEVKSLDEIHFRFKTPSVDEMRTTPSLPWMHITSNGVCIKAQYDEEQSLDVPDLLGAPLVKGLQCLCR